VAQRGGGGAAIAVAGYVLLFVLGGLEGLLGTFHYAATLGPVPAAALAWAAGIAIISALAAWGMRAATAGLMPAVGWFIVTFVLAMPTRGGSVVITNTSAGQWFLYGGTICAVIGVVVSFVSQSRARLAAEPRP
jgi:hypothetical protein